MRRYNLKMTELEFKDQMQYSPADDQTMTADQTGSSLLDYFRCPELPVMFSCDASRFMEPGFFRFGSDLLCYGRSTVAAGSNDPADPAPVVHATKSPDAAEIRLPFDFEEVIGNLRRERYLSGSTSTLLHSDALHGLYYAIRPLLPVSIRKHLQKLRLKDWHQIPFPRWPVDRTVDQLMEQLLLMILQSDRVKEIPFIWFWPDGASACAVMTHDVEAEPGKEFCPKLMDINESFAIPASFQIVPEERYSVSSEFLESIRKRGFEVNVQDLNHDGHLYRSYAEFCGRVANINQYGRDFQAHGFRSAILYRNQEWFRHLDFEYDMSVPNVAHLDPQRGGCCTIMPYFLEGILELPVTTTQDYSLFHILSDYSLDLWKLQADLILQNHGFMNFIVHPDYITTEVAQQTYRGLLGLISNLREERGVWVALPLEVNRWWRQRSRMRLVRQDNTWRIDGPGKERARVAVATLGREGLTYTVTNHQSISVD